MIDQLKFYSKIAYKVLKKDVISSSDYRKGYNSIANTYQYWIDKMGKFTNEIIKPAYMPDQKKLNILDFACGTGYITRQLLEQEVKCNITAVDISEEMLKACKDKMNPSVKFIHADGLEFLKQTDEKFDVIFCGWALPYFNYKELIGLFQKVLNEDGIVGVISNSQGTLYRIEEIFLNVMKQNQREIVKPMNIKFNLPNGKDGLRKWFGHYNFTPLELTEDEVMFAFDEPEELFEWINKTGAIAGTAQIFKNYDHLKHQLVEEIKKQKYENGKYVINHKFVYGIFRYC